MGWERTHSAEDEAKILELTRKQRTPRDIAREVGCNRPYVYYVLAKHGIDWIRNTNRGGLGRPRKPLLIGQQRMVEALYSQQVPQYDIAATVRASLPRIQRHLIERGLYERQARKRDQTDAILAAIAEYMEGDLKATDIIQKHHITAPSFYSALHARGIALRRNPGRPRRAKPLEQSQETVRDG